MNRIWTGGLAAAAGAALSAGVLAAGPDVTLLDIQTMAVYGPLNGKVAYSIGSHTCNIGNQNLTWAFGGTPGLGMNAYRLHEGRLMQIGLSNAKTACCAAASSGGCGTCNGTGGNLLGVGCLDVYWAEYNAGQTRLAPRSSINPYSGQFSGYTANTGDALYRRCQVNTSDVTLANYPGALWFMEGVYVGTDDAAAGNGLNNASYKRMTLAPNYSMSPTGSTSMGIPAIRAWRDHGLGVNAPDLSVNVDPVDVPGEGRYFVANKVRDLGNGTWRYDYAVFNLNSHRSGSSFHIPVPAGVTVTNIGFHSPDYHSGEPYNNEDWVNTCGGSGEICWQTPQTYAQNVNTNALRWGTMYNFWFDASTPPTTGTGSLGLFRPGTPESITFGVQVPTGASCYANCDGSTQTPILNVADFSCFLNQFASGASYANCDGSTEVPVLNVADFTCFLQSFASGCP